VLPVQWPCSTVCCVLALGALCLGAGSFVTWRWELCVWLQLVASRSCAPCGAVLAPELEGFATVHACAGCWVVALQASWCMHLQCHSYLRIHPLVSCWVVACSKGGACDLHTHHLRISHPIQQGGTLALLLLRRHCRSSDGSDAAADVSMLRSGLHIGCCAGANRAHMCGVLHPRAQGLRCCKQHSKRAQQLAGVGANLQRAAGSC
jgi:hypothetical protein